MEDGDINLLIPKMDNQFSFRPQDINMSQPSLTQIRAEVIGHQLHIVKELLTILVQFNMGLHCVKWVMEWLLAV